MERLTNGIDYCQLHCDFGKEKDCFFQDKTKCYEKNMYEKLRSYEDADEQGLLLRLPCPVGTTVYCIKDECEDIYIEGSDYRFVGEEIFDTWMLDQFGKTVFLTKEEAEQALAEMKGKI